MDRGEDDLFHASSVPGTILSMDSSNLRSNLRYKNEYSRYITKEESGA